MGSAMGWHCKNCGAQEEFSTGAGMASFNVPETRERIARGEFGEMAQFLLSDDCSLNVNTVDEAAVYSCPSCERLLEGKIIRFFSGKSGFELVMSVPPEKCPECGEEFSFVEDRIPASDGDIMAYVMKTVESGCPHCGSKDVEPTMVRWD